jgi:hypothetical protein
MNGPLFFLRGDAQSWTEGPFTTEAVLGRVTAAWRKGRSLNFERGFWRLVWIKADPLGFYLLRGALAAWRFIRIF